MGDRDVNARHLAGELVDPDAPGEVIREAEGQQRPGLHVVEWQAEALAELAARQEGRRHLVPVPWPRLRNLYGGGLRPGVHVLTGGTGVGKTAWALRVSLEALRSGHPVLYVALELDRLQLLARLVAAQDAQRHGPGWADLEWPTSKATADLVRAEVETIAGWPLYVAEPPAMGWTVDDLVREAKELREREAERMATHPALVVVDFLQLVGPAEHPDDRDLRGRIRRASYVARQLTRTHDVAVLMVSSVAREHYARTVLDMTNPPDPDELVGLGKESGEIEYAAHTVTSLAGTQGGGRHEVWAVVAKNRTGRRGYVALDWHGSHGLHLPTEDNERGRLADELTNTGRAGSRSGATPAKKAGGKGSRTRDEADPDVDAIVGRLLG